MSKPQPSFNDSRGDDTLQHMLDGLSRLLLWGGLAALVIGLGSTIYTYVTFSGSLDASQHQALVNLEIFDKILLTGLLALAAATTFMWWGEETLGIIQLGFGAALYFAPLYIPGMFGGVQNPVTSKALGILQGGGQIFGAIAVIVVVADILTRIKARAQQGSKADQLKYGKGVKEERDIRNVFMGKCWQLPFCRKFVRERCPIYHSKRTCWRERVGCMCEEEVIRNAMENKPIPKDQLMAVKYIPYNNRLSGNQKAERCRQCVIYNEHQKHKYKLVLPMTIIFFAGFYVLFRQQLLEATGFLIQRLDKVVAGATYRQADTEILKTGIFEEILLAAFVIVAFAYVMKMLEFFIFKLKI